MQKKGRIILFGILLGTLLLGSLVVQSSRTAFASAASSSPAGRSSSRVLSPADDSVCDQFRDSPQDFEICHYGYLQGEDDALLSLKHHGNCSDAYHPRDAEAPYMAGYQQGQTDVCGGR